jgi:hypothetical protein
METSKTGSVRPTPRRRSLKRALILAGALGVAASATYSFWPREPEYHAERVPQAAVRGDGVALASFSYPAVLQRAGMTPEKYRAVWSRLIEPQLEGWKSVESGYEEIVEGGDLMAWTSFESQRGDRLSLSVEVSAGDDTLHADPLLGMVIFAWRMRAGVYEPRETRISVEGYSQTKRHAYAVACRTAFQNGLRQDRAWLESMGISSTAQRNRFKSWAEWQASLDRIVAELQRGEAEFR